MKTKLIFLTLILLLSITIVEAAPKWDANLLDRPLMNVKNCFNLTVHYELTDGVAVPVYFSGCTDRGNGTWFCNCREDDNSYTLVMRTDKTMVRDAREYDIDVEGYIYSFYKDDVSYRVLDWGDYTEINGKQVNNLGKDGEGECTNADPEEVEKIVYVNQTVEVEKIVEKLVPQEVRVEDNTKILALTNQVSELEANNTALVQALNEKGGGNSFIMWFCLIGLIFTTGYIFYKKMGF